MDTGGGTETRLTRDELYELVWAEPIQKLAPRFGISDVAFKKTCVRMRVPTPGRGYWAKKAAGKTMRRLALPRLPDSVPSSTTTAVFRRAPKLSPKEKEEATGPVADQERYEALPEHRITMPEMLADPHTLVAESIHLLRKSRTDAQHLLVLSGKKCLDVSVTLGTGDRAMLLYDTLLKALAARGYTVAVESDEHGTTTTVAVGTERVAIGIDERVERVERKPDPKAKRPVFGKEYDYVPTGRLTLRLRLPYLSTRLRQSWWDGAKQRVEMCLNDFIVGIVAAAEALKQQRLEQEARARAWRAEEERRQLAEQRRQDEAARVRALRASLKGWRRSVVVREYAAAMRKAAEAVSQLGEGEPMTEWLQWVDAYADCVDPRHPVPTVPVDPEPHQWQHGPATRALGDLEDNW